MVTKFVGNIFYALKRSQITTSHIGNHSYAEMGDWGQLSEAEVHYQSTLLFCNLGDYNW